MFRGNDLPPPALSIRDPLHRYIDLTPQEVEILNTPPLQRLRRIKQLPHVDLVYPGANHTRFEHSLGMLFIAGRIAISLELADEEKAVIRCAALLHDAGHGPFSHEFEGVMKNISGDGVSHEDITRMIIDQVPQIRSALGDRRDAVLSLFKEEKDSIAGQIISGGIDADKMDYFLRDSYYAGVTYGVFDLERILHTITTTTLGPENYLVIREKGIDALDSFRLARFMMHTQVYFHHTRVIANRMFERAMIIAVKDGVISTAELDVTGKEFLSNFLSLDDSRLLIKLQSDPKSKASVFAKMLEERRLLKRGYEMNVTACHDVEIRMNLIRKKRSFESLEHALADTCRCDPDMIIVEQYELENSLLASSFDKMKDNVPPYLILDKNGKAHQVEEMSSLFSKPEPRIMFYIFCPKEYQETIRRSAESLIRDNL